MTRTQSHTPADAKVAPGEARNEDMPGHRLASPGFRKLLAGLGDLFRNRRQQRAGLYLPLVRLDRGE